MDDRLRRDFSNQADKEKMAEAAKKTEGHVSVLPEEVCSFARLAFGQGAPPLIFDGTLGEGGHTRLLHALFPAAALVASDRDPVMLARATESCRSAGMIVEPWSGGVPPGGELRTLRMPFSGAVRELSSAGLSFGFVLLDLGVSMFHFRSAGRGFSFGDESLDMRLDPDLERDAALAVNRLPEAELVRIFSELGEERFSKRIARAVVERRPIADARALSSIVAGAVPKHAGARIHPATRVFQALRMYVNDELGELERALSILPELLAPQGVLCVISFHSLEDRVVKRSFRAWAGRPLDGGARRESQFRILTKRPLVPGDDEARDNPASRSAKLRAIARAPVDIQNGTRGS